MEQRWSDVLSKQYHLRLPADLVDWLDQGVWRRTGAAEFRQPHSPEELLAPSPGMIWAGFMPPDALPLVGNEYGDHLCLRVAPEGDVSEIICWRHGGGDWTPYGANLAEALLFDAAIGSRDIELTQYLEESAAGNALGQWAREFLSKEKGATAEQLPSINHTSPDTPERALRLLQEQGIAAFAVARGFCLVALESEFKRQGDACLASDWDISWTPEFVSWLFDASLIPEHWRELIGQRFGATPEEFLRQDWPSAQRAARQCVEKRADLAWAFDILGWSHERAGEIEQAVKWYARGLNAPVFSDESIRFRSHWQPEGFGKFSASRLAEYPELLPESVRNDEYLQLFWRQDAESLHARVRDYWLERATAAMAANRYDEAYRCYYRAGWDYGLQYVDSFDDILGGLAESAQRAGWPALAGIAALHRQQLRS